MNLITQAQGIKKDSSAVNKAKSDSTVKSDSIKKKNGTKLKSSTTAEPDSVKEAKDPDPNSLAAHRDSIFKYMDNEDVIARFEMPKNLRIWKYIKDTSNYKYLHYDSVAKRYFVFWKKFDLLSVHLRVKEGTLMEITANTGAGSFRNKTATFDLVHFEDVGKQHLYYVGFPYYASGKDEFIFLDDVIWYYTLKSHIDIPYTEFDVTLSTDTIHYYYNVKESTSLNNYFNIAAFTDIKGLNNEPNGVAQFRGEAKFITNTRNFSGGATIPFNYLGFEGGLSKYDKQFKGSMLFYKDSVSRRDLYQRSSYSVGLKLNLIRGFPSPKPKHLLSDWQINLGYDFVGSQVADTSFKDKAKTVIDTSYRTVNLHDIYIEPQFTLSRTGNFGITVSLPFHFVNIKGDSGISNRGWEQWMVPTIELMYFAQKNGSNKLFFRYRSFTNLKDHSQGFTQIQLGYSLNLSSAWGKGGN